MYYIESCSFIEIDKNKEESLYTSPLQYIYKTNRYMFSNFLITRFDY
jgi:hypothetical protein